MRFLVLKGKDGEAARYFVSESLKAIVWWCMVITLVLMGGIIWTLHDEQDKKIDEYKMVVRACINADHIEVRHLEASNSLVFYCR